MTRRAFGWSDFFAWVALAVYVMVDFSQHWRGHPWTRSNTVCTTTQGVP